MKAQVGWGRHGNMIDTVVRAGVVCLRDGIRERSRKLSESGGVGDVRTDEGRGQDLAR